MKVFIRKNMVLYMHVFVFVLACIQRKLASGDKKVLIANSQLQQFSELHVLLIGKGGGCEIFSRYAKHHQN